MIWNIQIREIFLVVFTNGNSEESRRGCCSLLCLCYSCTEERKVVYFRKIVDRLLRNYQLHIKCESTELLSERPVIQFICRECYQRLTTFKRTLDNLNKAKGEIEEVFKTNVHRTKRLRRKEQIEEDIEEEIDEQLGQSARAISSRKIVSRSNGSSYPFKKICEPCSNFKLNVQSEQNFEIAAFSPAVLTRREFNATRFCTCIVATQDSTLLYLDLSNQNFKNSISLINENPQYLLQNSARNW